MTEIRVLDTYWSDHCRHTTFSTELKNVAFGDGFTGNRWKKPTRVIWMRVQRSLKTVR